MQNKVFVDTNYFLRFLLEDIFDQHTQAKKVFINAAEGHIQLFSSTLVFFEIYWVLTSSYKKDRTLLVTTLRKIISMTFVGFSERSLLDKALTLFEETPLELQDCYNLAYAQTEHATELATFDKKLQKRFHNRNSLQNKTTS